MRCDLVLVATVDGEPLEFVARDVPTGVFFAGFQDTFPGAPCYGQLSGKEQWANILGFEEWADRLLARALVEPVAPGLNAGHIRSLGTARDELAVGYLWGIGYQVPPPAERERLIPPRFIRAPALREVIADEEAFRELPPPNIRRLLQQVARGARRPAITVWEDWAISDFVKEWRLSHQDDMKKRGAGGDTIRQPTPLMDLVGRERS